MMPVGKVERGTVNTGSRCGMDVSFSPSNRDSLPSIRGPHGP